MRFCGRGGGTLYNPLVVLEGLGWIPSGEASHCPTDSQAGSLWVLGLGKIHGGGALDSITTQSLPCSRN